MICKPLLCGGVRITARKLNFIKMEEEILEVEIEMENGQKNQ